MRAAHRGCGPIGDYKETLERLLHSGARAGTEPYLVLMAAVAGLARHDTQDLNDALVAAEDVLAMALNAGAGTRGELFEYMVEALLAGAVRSGDDAQRLVLERLPAVLHRMDAASVPPSCALITSVCRLAAVCRSETVSSIAWQLLGDFVSPVDMTPELGEAALSALCAGGCNRTRALYVIEVLRRKRALSARILQSAADAALPRAETVAWLRQLMEKLRVPGTISTFQPCSDASGWEQVTRAAPRDTQRVGRPGSGGPGFLRWLRFLRRRATAGFLHRRLLPGLVLTAVAAVAGLLPSTWMLEAVAGGILGSGSQDSLKPRTRTAQKTKEIGSRPPGSSEMRGLGSGEERRATQWGSSSRSAAKVRSLGALGKGDVDMVDWVPDAAFDRT